MTSSSIAFRYNCTTCDKEIEVKHEDIDDRLARRSCCSNACLDKYLEANDNKEPEAPEGLRRVWSNSKIGSVTETLAFVKDEWAKNPQLRLGQLIANALVPTKTLASDLFNIENEELIEKLKGFSAKHGATNSDHDSI